MYAAQMLLSITYVFYCYGLLTDIHHFGWGKVPNANLKGFLWVSDNLEWISTTIAYSSVVVFAFLIYQTASVLERLGVNKHLGTGMTTASLFIPFYNFYRPWAGIGEVSNTLDAAVARRSIPFIGIRGANTSTVILALAIYTYALVEKFFGVYAAEIGKRQFGSQTAGLSFLSDISFLVIVETLLTGVFLGVVVWYWTRIIRNYHDAISFPQAAVNYPETAAPLPARDVLQVGTRSGI